MDSSVANNIYQVQDQFQLVETIDLQSLMDMVLGDDVFLKLDCEGSEWDIIMNADPELMKRISRISLEIHTDIHPLYQSADIMRQHLRKLGYIFQMGYQMESYHNDDNGNKIHDAWLPLCVETWSRP
jgi:phage terminase small subunit